MQKILQINITCGRGSTGKIAEALFLKTKQEGYESRFAYSAYTPTLSEAFSIETRLQNYLRRGLNRFFGRKQSHSTPGTKRLIRYIRKEQPDLIHIHNVQQNCVNYRLLFDFLKKAKIPVVYTLHDCWPFTGGCFHFTSINCDQFSVGCVKCPNAVCPDDIRYSAKESFDSKKDLIGKNERIFPVCVSKWLRNVSNRSYLGAMKQKTRVIYNGINLNKFFPQQENLREKLGIDDDTFLILGVSSVWTEEKGLSHFLNLAEHLPPDWKILLVGAGTEMIEKNNILTLSRTENQKQLAQIYSTADVYFNASIEETFGLTTAEALSCGTPAIVFDSTACPEIVDGHTGIVVPANATNDDVLAVLAEIKRLGKEHYSSACVARAKALFDEQRMLTEYLALYRSILDDTLQKPTTE